MGAEGMLDDFARSGDMTTIQVNVYVCPECKAGWCEFRIGPRICPSCGRFLDIGRGFEYNPCPS